MFLLCTRSFLVLTVYSHSWSYPYSRFDRVMAESIESQLDNVEKQMEQIEREYKAGNELTLS